MRWLRKSGRTAIAWDIHALWVRIKRRRMLILLILIYVALAVMFALTMVMHSVQDNFSLQETATIVIATNIAWETLRPSPTPVHWPSWTPTPDQQSKP